MVRIWAWFYLCNFCTKQWAVGLRIGAWLYWLHYWGKPWVLDLRMMLGWAVILKAYEGARRKHIITHEGPAIGVCLETVLEPGCSPLTTNMWQTSPPSGMSSWSFRNVGEQPDSCTAGMAFRCENAEEDKIYPQNTETIDEEKNLTLIVIGKHMTSMCSL